MFLRPGKQIIDVRPTQYYKLLHRELWRVSLHVRGCFSHSLELYWGAGFTEPNRLLFSGIVFGCARHNIERDGSYVNEGYIYI